MYVLGSRVQHTCMLTNSQSEYIQAELAEIIANHEYELSVIPAGNWLASWAHCFSGSVFSAKSNVRRTILGYASLPTRSHHLIVR